MNEFAPNIQSGKRQYLQATGDLPHPLTNDYMFKALLQKNENALKHLICSLLHLHPEEVESVEIQNPIVLGQAISADFDSRIFVLDINVLLDNWTLINLEMQVIKYRNWLERSLPYLCRNYDRLFRGEDYLNARPAIHIGFLDFELFPEQSEFYATYKMMNVKNHHVFTDKFVRSVVDLKHIELATEEDREWKTDYWASLFKATTWEELKMLAKQSPVLEEAVETVYELTADERIREQCKAREKYMREVNTVLREKEIAVQERDRMRQERDKLYQEKDGLQQEKDGLQQEIDELWQEKDELCRERDVAVQKTVQQAQEIDRLLQEIERLKNGSPVHISE